MINRIYPEKLELFLSDYPDYIPYPYTKYDQLKLYRRYYTEDDQIIKILEIYDILDTTYYYMKINNSLQAVIPYPVNDIKYELIPLYNEELPNEKIINSDQWYTGAEIKYWFFINKIDLNSTKYSDLKPYLYINGNCELNDINMYKILYNRHYFKIIGR